MAYYSDKKEVKEPKYNKTIAVATYVEGAEIIAKALNLYFSETFTRNEASEMHLSYGALVLNRTIKFVEKNEYTREEIIDWMTELAEEMEAQALVVSMRDELKFDKPL